MQEGDGSSTKPLEKADFIVKITVPVMVRPANSDKWKEPLVNNLARRWPGQTLAHWAGEFKGYLPWKKICFSQMTGQNLFQAL